MIKLGEALPGRLELVEADLMQDGSFDDAVEGATYVFHTASPYIISGVQDPQKELVEPAVKGTLNVLNSVAKSKSIKRVVLTSSIVGELRMSLWFQMMDIECPCHPMGIAAAV